MTELYPYAAAACGVLHNVFYHKPTPAFLAELSDSGLLDQWPDLGTPTGAAIAQVKASLAQDDFDTIEREHYRLFIGPGEIAAYPWGSVYTDKENLVFGDTTVALARFCREKGVAFELAHREPEDHIGLILALLGQLFEQQDQAGVTDLLTHHLLPWSHRFTEAVAREARTGYYAGFGDLLATLLGDWQRRLAITPDPLQLYK
ncbi:molecular chaperone [Ferrimonas balearica]|uniref:TorD/DmsD family molecular chaperone n=1 Tax=Ferrimonas balearica TaxID=44012 RepID=UPI001C99A60B|nr:molecular chaperone TorD family protein [Ferrimonas balearica]MBY5993279.1 molecular chaperone TorD family protein [Ferrimonas balearica]